MITRRASCSCGQLVVTCQGEPIRISMCHCYECQKRSGSVFAAQARFPNERVTIEGRSTEYVRKGDEGSTLRFRFCPTCGSTVHYSIDDWAGVTAVAVGAFADASFPEPAFSVYEDRKHAWVVVPQGAERMA